jgi:hypothetical protein
LKRDHALQLVVHGEGVSVVKLFASRSAQAALVQSRMLARAIASMGVAVLLGWAVPAVAHALQALKH